MSLPKSNQQGEEWANRQRETNQEEKQMGDLLAILVVVDGFVVLRGMDRSIDSGDGRATRAPE